MCIHQNNTVEPVSDLMFANAAAKIKLYAEPKAPKWQSEGECLQALGDLSNRGLIVKVADY